MIMRFIFQILQIELLNYDDDMGFATILCKSEIDNELNAISLLDLRGNKKRIHCETNHGAEKKIKSHECGIILYPKLSCYSAEMVY